MPPICAEGLWVGLNRLVAGQKYEADGIARNADDKTIRIFEHASNAPMQPGYINRPLGRRHGKFLRREPAVSGDIRQHFFRGLPGEPAGDRANYGTQGKNIFVDGHKLDNIPRFAAVGGGGRFVRGKVNGVEDVAKKFVPLCGKKNERRCRAPTRAASCRRNLRLQPRVCRFESFPTRG